MFSAVLRRCAKVAWFVPGFLLWAAFPPMGERMDCLFALAPLLWLARQGDAKESVRRWFQNGLLFWLLTLKWFPAIIKNGGPWPLVFLGWVGLAAYCTLFFVLFGSVSARFWAWAREGDYGRRLLGIFLVEPLLWSGLELVRCRFLGGFAWNPLGLVLANSGFGGPAAWGGVYLLSAIVVMINGTIAGIAERFIEAAKGRAAVGWKQRIRSAETLVVFLLILAVYKLPSASAPSSEMLKVALVQRNFPCVFQTREENPYAAYQKLLDHVAPLAPQLVVLSESAMAEFGPLDQQGAVRFARFVSQTTGGAAVLGGGSRAVEGETYNSAGLYTFATNGLSSLEVYDKVHLVPFGEFIPGDRWLPALKKLAPVGSCAAGEPKLLSLALSPTSSVPIAVTICFEDTDAALVRELANKGARLLVVVSNDSWFSHSIEPEQHAWQLVARAIETGLPVVRVGNSGVSGTVAPNGRATWLIGEDGRVLVDQRGTMFDRVVLAEPGAKTVYRRVGDIPLFFAFALLIMTLIMVKYRNHHEQRRIMSL